MNTSDADEIQAAYEWLLDMNNTMNPTDVTEEVIDGMAKGKKDIAICLLYTSEHQRNPAQHTGQGKGQCHLQKALHGRCAKVARRLQQAFIHLRKGGMNLQYHKGNEVIDHPQNNCKGGIEHVEGANAEHPQKTVHQTIILQNTHPRIDVYKRQVLPEEDIIRKREKML